MKINLFLTILAGLVTLSLLWLMGGALPLGWRILVAIYGGLVVAGTLSVLFKE